MNRWFAADSLGPARFKIDDSGARVFGSLPDRVGRVSKKLKADVLTIQEGPSRREEMALFVSECLNDEYDILGPSGKGQQKLFALIRKESQAVSSAERLNDDLGFDFNAEWEADVDGDMRLANYKFTRPPLVIRLTTSSGTSIRLVSLHLKSKYVQWGASKWRNLSTRHQFVSEALRARRRISAEAMRVREYLDLCFCDDVNAAIVVTGDLNDGPDFDHFEKHFLTHNLAAIVGGSPLRPRRMLRHAFIDTMPKDRNFTTEFDNFITGVDSDRVVLDHIFVSASLYWNASGGRNASGRIEHQAFEDEIDGAVPRHDRKYFPSDHRPQSVTIEI